MHTPHSHSDLGTKHGTAPLLLQTLDASPSDSSSQLQPSLLLPPPQARAGALHSPTSMTCSCDSAPTKPNTSSGRKVLNPSSCSTSSCVNPDTPTSSWYLLGCSGNGTLGSMAHPSCSCLICVKLDDPSKMLILPSGVSAMWQSTSSNRTKSLKLLPSLISYSSAQSKSSAPHAANQNSVKLVRPATWCISSSLGSDIFKTKCCS